MCVRERERAGREREIERERGRRAIWIGVWSIFKRFSRVLTWSDQKHPTGTGPCSHKGRPLMPLPWLPCWPTTPPPIRLCLTRCCDIKFVHRSKSSIFFNPFVFAVFGNLGTLPSLMNSKILVFYTSFTGKLLLWWMSQKNVWIWKRLTKKEKANSKCFM